MGHVKPKLTVKDLEDYSTLQEFRESPVYAAEILLNREYDPQQAIAIYGAWKSPYSMLDWGRGLGKMTAKGTFLYSSEGTKTFADLLPDEILCSKKFKCVPAEKEIKVLTPDGMRVVKNWMSSGRTKTMTFHTRKGYTLKVCDSNPTMTIKNGNTVWESSGDLSVGDYLPINRNNEKSKYLYKYNDLSVETSYFMGCLIGDGSINAKGTISLHNADTSLNEAFKEYVKNEYNITCREYSDVNKMDTYRTTSFSSVKIREKLVDMGLDRATAIDKKIPHLVWSASPDAQAAFLRGLFDTDGSSTQTEGYIFYSSISKQLAEEVHFLLLTFGIVSKIRRKNAGYKDKQGVYVKCNDSYEISILDVKNCELYYNLIGFDISRKQININKLKSKTNSNQDIIPDLHHIYKKIEELQDFNNKKYKDNELRQKHLKIRKTLYGKYATTYEMLPLVIDYYDSVAEFLDIPKDNYYMDYLRSLLEWNFFFDQIVEIEEGEDYMYDLEIEPLPGDRIKHGFIANGFVIHNCVVGDTMVKLHDNTQVSIEDLFNRQSHNITFNDVEWWAVLDEQIIVKSYDPSAKKLDNRQILTILKQKVNQELVKITFSSNLTVVCTKGHKFLDMNARWIEAANLSYEDSIVGLANAKNRLIYHKVVEIEWLPAQENYVYDLCVPDLKNYVANNIISHNTTIASDIEILSGLLYPGTISMVVSHSMKGAKQVFDELIKTYVRSPVVRDSTMKRPTKGNDLCEMIFNSINPATGQQTIVKGIAADINNEGATIRGQRVSRILHIDEWIILPLSLIYGAIFPCASTTDDPTRPEYDLNLTRFLLTSSSGYTYMEAYKMMSTWREFFLYPEKYPDQALDKNGNPKYFYHNCNYTKIVKPGILNFDNIKMWKATFPVTKFNIEVMAQWESESGSWYNSKELRGDPENKIEGNEGIYVKSEHDENARYIDKDLTDNYFYILAVDPAEQQDETGVCLLRITPNKIYIADTQGYKNTEMTQVAEIIRQYIDRYPNIKYVLIDHGGGGLSVIRELKNAKNRQNVATSKQEMFQPLFPEDLKKWLNKNEAVPAGARMIVKPYTFSGTAKDSSVTDWNRTLRTLIKNKDILVASDSSIEFQERVELLFNQIIAIEAMPQTEKGASNKTGKQAVDQGRFKFTSRILKDRWAALLMASWEAIMIQSQMNLPEEDEESAIMSIDDIFGIRGIYGGMM